MSKNPREEFLSMAGYSKIGSIGDLPPGSAMSADVAGTQVAIFNVDGTLHAIDEACSHVGGPLSKGVVTDTSVRCPLHGASFDLITGEATGPPDCEAVKCYEVRVEGDEIQVANP
ncbi:MAG: 3-phenylpropionate/trans-cinnamate dioxygenase ferredoxin subunit [Chlamydiales bacterium]